ncbi:cohesin domain-containing protein [Ningiella sp. W23]|uniref:cohesin domain-containing protein n=1 Tax=Ningiella sp. W23 TaxID=3023715 RepID=UPI0037569C88
MTLLSSRIGFCFVALCLLFHSQSAKALLISIQASPSTVSVGDTIDIEFWASDLNPDLIAAYDFDLSFDSTLVTYVSASFSNFLGNDDFFSFADVIQSGNSLNLSELSFLSDAELGDRQFMAPSGDNPDESFMLASLSFSTLMAGTTSFSISADGLGQGFIGADFEQIDDVFERREVSVDIEPLATSVPSPTAWGLLISAIALIILLRASARE